MEDPIWPHIKDAHTHNLMAGPDAIINLPRDAGQSLRPDRFYSVGVHPWDTLEPFDLEAISACAESQQVLAIGECGLDALRGAPLQRQEEIFRWHVRLSERLGKPLIIHAVRTLQRIIELRKELKPAQRWIVHGFRGKPQLAEALIRSGIDISIGTKHNPEALSVIPADRLHHETDEDY